MVRKTSLDSNDFIDEEEDPDLMDAIMASLLQPDKSKHGATLDPKEFEDDRRLLKEVM